VPVTLRREPWLELGRVPAALPEARRLLQGRRRVPRRARLDPKGKRSGGEWRVEKQRLRWDVLDAFALAAQQPASGDRRFNRGDNEGVGYFDVNQKAGIRWNRDESFSAAGRAAFELQVWTGAHISRVLLENGATVGIEVQRPAAASRCGRASRPAAK